MDTATMTPETTLPVPIPMNGKNGHAKTSGKNGHGVEADEKKKMKAKSNKKAAKPKAPKAAKTTGAKRGKPAREELKFADMTKDEQKLVRYLHTAPAATKINDLQKEVFGVDKKRGSSKTRNTLRRPVKFGWIEQVDRGAYRLTKKGRDAVRRMKD